MGSGALKSFFHEPRNAKQTGYRRDTSATINRAEAHRFPSCVPPRSLPAFQSCLCPSASGGFWLWLISQETCYPLSGFSWR